MTMKPSLFLETVYLIDKKKRHIFKVSGHKHLKQNNATMLYGVFYLMKND